MRLTLRTMLAYLDDILEPDDREEIGQKIKDSEFASELVHRVRDMTRRLRLGAPPVLGQGMGQDANTVAEYLDNTLAAERVADLERACLDSDIQLAEVAACHQILTLVLGEPAEIEPALREQMYQVREHAEEVLKHRADAVPSAAVTAATTERVREKPTVPDYLRESARARRRRVAAVIVVAASLFVAAFFAFRPGGFLNSSEGEPVVAAGDGARPNGGDATTETAGTGDQSSVEDPVGGVAASDDEVEGTAESGGSNPDVSDGESTPQVVVGAQPDGDAAADSSQPDGPTGDVAVAPGAGGNSDLPSEATDKPPAGEGNVADGAVADDPGGQVNPDDPPDPMTNGTAPDVAGAADDGDQTDEPNAEMIEQALADAAAVLPDESEPVEPAAVPVGTYGDQERILLRHDDEIREWRRLPTRAPLFVGDRVLALPTFRPTVTLANGAIVEVAGGSLIDFAAVGEATGIDVIYGRLIITNSSPQEVRLDLGMVGDRATITLLPQATLALEVRRENVPGADPREGPGAVTAHMVAVSGSVRWGDDESAKPFAAPSQWTVESGEITETGNADEMPAWIDGERLNKLEQLAALTLEDELEMNRSARLTLREMVEEQRKEEVRSLAAKCSVHVAEFEPFVLALNDSEIAPAWRPDLIRALLDALALGPETAEQVRAAFVATSGETDGQELYRLLWSYRGEKVNGDQKQQLVDYLNHDRLEFRLLGLWNLTEYTGLGSRERLSDPRANNQQIIRRWQGYLENGRIEPPAPAKIDAAG